jgi:hypothetical protein
MSSTAPSAGGGYPRRWTITLQDSTIPPRAASSSNIDDTKRSAIAVPPVEPQTVNHCVISSRVIYINSH